MIEEKCNNVDEQANEVDCKYVIKTHEQAGMKDEEIALIVFCSLCTIS